MFYIQNEFIIYPILFIFILENKGKKDISLFINGMKVNGGVEIKLHVFQTSTTNRGVCTD